MQKLLRLQHQLYLHAEALAQRSEDHAQNHPGDSYIERLMAEHVRQLADELGRISMQRKIPAPHP